MGIFQKINYPDGQVSAKYLPDEVSSPHPSRGVPRISGYDCAFRINGYDDLMFVRAVAELIHSWNAKGSLFIPCLFGQRSDRRFDENQSFDLKIIAEVINACKFEFVKILDPHSDVALALINNSVKESSFQYVEKAIKHYHDFNSAHYNYSVDPILVSPDAGAYKKVFEYGEKLGLEVVAAVKHRDKDGKVDLKFIGDVKDKACFIVDDLCDGGYTFLVLADALKAQGAREIYLYVTHGLFSKGFVELQKNINHIYCTNSIKDLNDREIYGYHGEPWQKISDYVTQFKVI